MLQNISMRQQLAIYKRKKIKPKMKERDPSILGISLKTLARLEINIDYRPTRNRDKME